MSAPFPPLRWGKLREEESEKGGGGVLVGWRSQWLPVSAKAPQVPIRAKAPSDLSVFVSSGDKGFIITQLTGWGSVHAIGQSKLRWGSCTVYVAKKFWGQQVAKEGDLFLSRQQNCPKFLGVFRRKCIINKLIEIIVFKISLYPLSKAAGSLNLYLQCKVQQQLGQPCNRCGNVFLF